MSVLARSVTGWWTGIWSSWRAGAGPSTLWAVAFDLKAFFTVIEKDPLEGVARVCAVARRPPTRAVMEG
jgi:hypothetical protein